MDNKMMTKLNDELAYLKSTKLYTLHFKPNHILQFFQDFGEGSHVTLARLASKIEKDMYFSYGMSVYLAIKWLALLHQILQNSQRSFSIEKVIGYFGHLPTPNFKTHFEEYIHMKLIAPYKQYLIKLAAILLNKVERQSSPRESQKLLNEPENIYCIHNLIRYALQEFSNTIKEFSRFFSKHYPSLNDYIALIGRDQSKFIKSMKLSYERDQIKTLTFLEVEQLESQLSVFNQNAHLFANSWIFPETNAQSFEFLDEYDITAKSEQPFTSIPDDHRMVLKVISPNQ